MDRATRQPLYTDFRDDDTFVREVSLPLTTTGVNVAQYRKKVEQFIRAHEDYWAIHRIRAGIPLQASDLTTLEVFFYQADEVGGRAQFEEAFGPQENLALFIRSLVGLDRKAAQEKFARFLDEGTHTADQIRFVAFIIDHLTANGVMPPEMLYEQPFTDIHDQGLDGLFTNAQVDNLLDILSAVNDIVVD